MPVSTGRSSEIKWPLTVAEKVKFKGVVKDRRKSNPGLVNLSFLVFPDAGSSGQHEKMPTLIPFNKIKGRHFSFRNTLRRDYVIQPSVATGTATLGGELKLKSTLKELHQIVAAVMQPRCG